MSNVVTIGRKPSPELRFRQKLRRQHVEQLQAEVAARELRELNDHFSDMLAAALEIELASAEFRRLTETW